MLTDAILLVLIASGTMIVAYGVGCVLNRIHDGEW